MFINDIATKPKNGAHAFVYYDKNGKPHTLYSKRPPQYYTTWHVIRGVAAFFVLAIFLLCLAFSILFILRPFSAPEKIQGDWTQTTPVCEAANGAVDADYIKPIASDTLLQDALNYFQNETGITPVIVVYPFENPSFDEMETRCEYFCDTTHDKAVWMIFYSPNSSNEDFRIATARSVPIQKLLETSDVYKFKDYVREALESDMSDSEALAWGLVLTADDIMAYNSFAANFFAFLIILALALIVPVIILMRRGFNMRHAYYCPDGVNPTVFFACPRCHGNVVAYVHPTCPHCGVAFYPAEVAMHSNPYQPSSPNQLPQLIEPAPYPQNVRPVHSFPTRQP